MASQSPCQVFTIQGPDSKALKEDSPAGDRGKDNGMSRGQHHLLNRHDGLGPRKRENEDRADKTLKQGAAQYRPTLDILLHGRI